MPKHFLYNLALLAAADVLPQAPARAFAARVGRRLAISIKNTGITLAEKFGGAYYQNTPDRLLLENVIFPYYQLSDAHQNILFVGCDWYTFGYQRLFALKTFATIDPNRDRARFGADRHQVAPMRNLGAVHEPASLDVVFCNGVIGWGLDSRQEAEASFEAAWLALRPGGHFIIGWNDLDRHLPFTLESVTVLAKFEPLVFPPAGSHETRVPNEMNHVFSYYKKPASR